MASAVTRATLTSCDAWDSSREMSIEVKDGRSPLANVSVIAQNGAAREDQTCVAKAWPRRD